MNSIQSMINELFVFHSGCHDNQIPISARYEADAYRHKEPPYQI